MLFLVIFFFVYVLGWVFVGKVVGLIVVFLIIVICGGWYDLGWFWILEMGVWFFVLGMVLIFCVLVFL